MGKQYENPQEVANGRSWAIVLTVLIPVPFLFELLFSTLFSVDVSMATIIKFSLWTAAQVGLVFAIWNGKGWAKNILTGILGFRAVATLIMFFIRGVSLESALDYLPFIALWSLCIWILNFNNNFYVWHEDRVWNWSPTPAKSDLKE